MNRRTWMILVVMLAGSAALADDHPFSVQTDAFSARFMNGSLESLAGPDGHVYVRAAENPRGLGIHRIDTQHWATSSQGAEKLNSTSPVVRQYGGFTDLDAAKAEATFHIDEASGDLVVGQHCSSTAKGVWGISWSIAEIPLDYAIIVPARSGIRLTAEMPGRRQQFDYPIGWEAQLVIVEGREQGFFVWAEDVKGQYKRLIVKRDDHGWRLTFITINQAPFDELTACQSVRWHLNTYRGDWRVPARRYRDWTEANFRPTPIEQQQPGWVKEIRSMVIMGMNEEILDALPQRLDPAQTILYVPSWRSAGYDRDYPVYDEPYDGLKPFVERAHELGFRIMLHVNYFGVDPLNPLYEKFEPYQVRSPWGKHEKQWWLWTRAEPEIRFAYINPALKAWRDHFTNAMVSLCRDYKIDSLHLDQTVAIFNDHNGLIDGMSMLEGNLALHRQLREALPEVALSGEGLNEVTYRHEAFAQRHAWGVNHVDGTWNRRWLRLAHPISSYLLRPCTIINGYLGCAPPTSGQLYAAWNEAYEHWGVIPTLKPSLSQIREPVGFSRQFFDEVAFWQAERLEIDMEAAWPDEVAFPFRTADGRRVVRTTDGRFVCGEKEISRTITGVTQLEASGTIPGWGAYDGRRLLGLDPVGWYPYVDQPRDENFFHVAELPDNLIVDAVVAWDDLAMVRTSSATTVVADLVTMLDRAVGGSRPFEGQPFETTGSFTAADGASFQAASDDTLSAHPPWKAQRTNPDTGATELNGSGIAYARYTVELPREGRLRLASDVVMAHDAIGENRTDGATFGVTVRWDEQELHCEVHNATNQPKPLELDLTPLAGRRVTVELTVHPGPNRSVSYDWARWQRPRIEQEFRAVGNVAVAGSAPWAMALSGVGPCPIETAGPVQRVRVPLPGSVLFLRQEPAPVGLPLDLSRQPRIVGVLRSTGLAEDLPDFVGVHEQQSAVGGQTRGGLFAHPPDHGSTVVQLPMTLPPEAGVFRSWVGIRDGSTSTGVVFIVEVNGQAVARRRMLPGKWESLSADLSAWKGAPVVVSLITDSDGGYNCDWAHWGEPRVEKRTGDLGEPAE